MSVADLSMQHRFRPHPQPLSQAWERGARAGGEGRMRSFRVRANHTPIQKCQVDERC
jgi:hypothetical protein